MLASSKIKIIHDLVAGLTKEEMIWLNGYLAGLVAADTKKEDLPVQEKKVTHQITIAYGTETGNSKKLATTFAARAKKTGVQVKVIALDQYRLNELSKEEWFFIIISTQGDGEPPAAAKKFYDYLYQNKLTLSNTKYGVLALGDTAYPLFCKAGEDVDIQLNSLGATRVIPLQKLDTDYEAEAEQWFNTLMEMVSRTQPVSSPAAVITEKKTGRQHYKGIVMANINLNANGSNKQTWHIELAAQDVLFEPGDSIGVVPENDKEVIKKILALTGVESDTVVEHKSEKISITELLRARLSLFHLPERVVKKYSEVVQQEIPETRIDLADLLRIYPVNSAEQFIRILHILEPVTPRLYSIASSPVAHAGEVHITVAKHKFNVNGHAKNGICSEYLSRLKEGDEIEFYVHKNHLFKLPDADRDIIMIGPGTGVAPFRSFIAERDVVAAAGRSWLFFGEQYFTTDFLYQTEWQNWLQTGALTKMNVAFSRDQNEKLYVQHKLIQHAAEVYNWIETGAFVYICGAKEPMSVDVENTLLHIIKEQKKCTGEDALHYLEAMKEEGRYMKDVY